MKTKSLDVFSFFLYAPIWLLFLCLSKIGTQAEPFGLPLLFALCLSGLNPLLCSVGYFLSSLLFWDLRICTAYLAQAILLGVIFSFFPSARQTFLLHGKQKIGAILPPFAALALSLLIFLFLPPYQAYPLPFQGNIWTDVWVQKAVFVALFFLLSAVFSIATNALLNKCLKCRLRIEELLFSALLYLLTGIGFCRFFGFYVYLGATFFFLLVFCHVVKDASVILFSFVLALPCALLGGTGIERFFILSVLLLLFSRTGKWGLVFSLLSTLVCFAFIDGTLSPNSTAFLPTLLSAILPCIFFLFFPKTLISKAENELIFYREKHLARISLNLSRAAVGGQLFELSTMFKEIQTTFSSLSDDGAEENACAFIVNTVWQECCHGCPGYKNCQARAIKKDLQKLVEVGCLKGRTSLIDMTDNLAHACERQSDLLYCVNHHLTDFRRFMTEAENAASGRELLAMQAKGISDILKNVALEQSQPLERQTQTERNLTIAFLKAGIVCTEIMCFGEEDFTLSLISYGEADVKKIANVAQYVLKTPLIISKRIPLSREKCCFIFKKRPLFDAVFGVASRTKSGEKACGDTYSVIKIDERRFLVALADGMGSGEYAQRISACTLSLLESFYRAKMPPDLILSTVNKLLSFSKDERFTCVDIGVVDLDNGKTDLIKIGAPTSFIVSEKSLQILESSSLPLGILGTLNPDCTTYPLKENDVLLFVSDGVSSAFGSTADMCDILKIAPCANPQQLAESILDKALQRYDDTPKDDMTVLAVRLFKPAA